jgi:hypothetical protein
LFGRFITTLAKTPVARMAAARNFVVTLPTSQIF